MIRGGCGGGALSYHQYFQPAENTKLQKEALPATVKRRKLAWFGHVTRHNSLSRTILGLTGEEEELAKLAECLDKASTAYGMEISAEKTTLMTNNTSGINTEIKVNGQKLETVTSFKYLGSVIMMRVPSLKYFQG